MIPAADGSLVITSTYKKTGGYAVRDNAATARMPAGGVANPSASFWVYPRDPWSYSASIWGVRFDLSTGENIALRWDSTNKTFDAYVDGVKVADGTIIVPSNDWFHVQFYVVIADAGSIQVKIDGKLSIDYSGDTQPGAAAVANYFTIYNNVSSYVYYDDLAIGYGGFLGDIRCIDIRPSADTAQDDWTPSAGDNYSTIDETPPSDADYNETNVDAQADELALGDFDGVTYNPVAVTAWVRAQMLAATGDSIKVGIDSGGTDDVTEHALSTTWQYYFHTADLNPADAAEWEDADIDALLLRYESVIA